MAERPSSPRPHGVTAAGLTAAVACALLLVVLFDTMGSLRSTQNQDAVRRFLSTPPGSSLGLGVGQVIDLMHVLVLVSGALAASGAVLAAYALRRHRGARVGLAVVAGLMVLVTTFVAGLLPFVVAFAAAMLWRQDARDWFDGRTPRRAAPPAAVPPRPTVSSGPGVPQPQPALPSQPQPQPQPQSQPWPGRPEAMRRPGSVTAAALVTWVFSGITLLALVVLVVSLVAQPGALLTAVQQSPRLANTDYTREELLAALWVCLALGIVWSLAAIGFAVLAFRGARAGQVGLLVSAFCAGLVGIASIVVPAAAVATIVLLLRGDSQRWFSARREHHPRPRPPVW